MGLFGKKTKTEENYFRSIQEELNDTFLTADLAYLKDNDLKIKPPNSEWEYKDGAVIYLPKPSLNMRILEGMNKAIHAKKVKTPNENQVIIFDPISGLPFLFQMEGEGFSLEIAIEC